jgi:hypothetical protein
MIGQKITSNSELLHCIEQQQILEIWMNGELEERCLISSFNEVKIKTIQGCYYPRSNITMLKGRSTKVYEFNK